MRYELDENGYVLNVFWGCHSGKCAEYTGTVPSGYSDLNEWSEKAIINAYYLVDGNLTLDSNRNYKLQLIQKQEAEENACVTKKEMGIASTDEMNPYTDLYPSQQSAGGYITSLSEKFNKVGNLPTEEVNLSVLKEQNLDLIELEFIGNNFLPNTASNSASNGIKYSRNIDKTINISGTATDRSTLNLAGTDTSINNILTFKENVNYLLFGLADGVSLEFYNYDGTARTLIGTYSGGIITFAEDINITQVVLVVDKGTSINTTIKPMLQLVSLKYPVLPMKKYKNDNLFNIYDWYNSITSNNGTKSLNDNSIEFIAIANSMTTILSSYNFNLKPNTTYTLSFNASVENVVNGNTWLNLGLKNHDDTSCGIIYINEDGFYSKTFTTNSNGDFYLKGYVNTDVSNPNKAKLILSNIMLNEGSIAEGYIPYINRENQYYVDGVSTQKTISGNQKFRENGLATEHNNRDFWNTDEATLNSFITILENGWVKFKANNTSSTDKIYNFIMNRKAFELEPDTQYTLILEFRNVVNNNSNGYFNPIADSVNASYFTSVRTIRISTISEGIQKHLLTSKTDLSRSIQNSYMYLGAGESCEFECRMSIVKGDYTLTEYIYETYGVSPSPEYPSEIINTYKAGIYSAIVDNKVYTFTIPEDLRSLPDGVSDRLWIDVDGDNGIDIERKVGSVVLDGVNYYLPNKDGTTYNNMFITNSIPNIKKVVNNNNLGNILSTHFKNEVTDIMFLNDVVGIGSRTSYQLSVGFGLNSEITSTDLANNWLLENNVIVYYQLETYTTSFLPSFTLEKYEYEEYKNNTTLIDLAGNKLTIPDNINLKNNQIILEKSNGVEIYLGDTVMPRTYTPYTHAYCHQKVYINFKYKDPRNVDITKINLKGLLSITDIETEYNFTSDDLTKIQNYIMDTGTLTDEEIELYDVNGDGVISASDYVLIKNMINGVISNKITGTLEINSTKSQRTIVLRDSSGKIKTSLGLNGATTPSISTEQLILDGTKQPKIMSGTSLPEEVTDGAVFLLYDE